MHFIRDFEKCANSGGKFKYSNIQVGMCLGASSPFMQENCRASCGWCTQAKKDVCYQKGEVRGGDYSVPRITDGSGRAQSTIIALIDKGSIKVFRACITITTVIILNFSRSSRSPQRKWSSTQSDTRSIRSVAKFRYQFCGSISRLWNSFSTFRTPKGSKLRSNRQFEDAPEEELDTINA